MVALKLLVRALRGMKESLYWLPCVIIGNLKARFFFDKTGTNKLEIGAGRGKRSGFITLDMNLSADFPYDLRFGLPFQDNSMDLIYAEHVLEHFDIQDLLQLLRECVRVLKPEGKVSIVVPDVKIYIDGYNKQESFDREYFCRFDFGLPYKSKIDFLNYIFYMGGHHKYMFDAQNMLALLTLCGFSKVFQRAFDEQLDKADRQYESIYFEAIK